MIHATGSPFHGAWFACEHPERPHDAKTVYDWDCRGCMVAMEAFARREPDHPLLHIGPEARRWGSVVENLQWAVEHHEAQE